MRQDSGFWYPLHIYLNHKSTHHFGAPFFPLKMVLFESGNLSCTVFGIVGEVGISPFFGGRKTKKKGWPDLKLTQLALAKRWGWKTFSFCFFEGKGLLSGAKILKFQGVYCRQFQPSRPPPQTHQAEHLKIPGSWKLEDEPFIYFLLGQKKQSTPKMNESPSKKGTI